ncbi:hypothetical protein [Brevundimonas lenta]|uniref:Uncharacterized protein n=1 Tax=Brevundimonas lenta TaxID=424796 RepID=A0A7W6JBE3_9CAUL|nr:hypothetical protein [Brevundimonas lenta]MBB4081967.1 hypothetical protein [Brevundimonas lenta]
MTRNHLLKLTLQPRRAERSVWRMTLDVIGQAFGARSPEGGERGR